MIACACMGPQGNDPVCPCKMRALGKEPTGAWTPEEVEQLKTDSQVKKNEVEVKKKNKKLLTYIQKLDKYLVDVNNALD